MPDLSFKSVFSLDLLQPSEALAAQPDHRGGRSSKDEDSAGAVAVFDAPRLPTAAASCDPFITCCARKTQTPEAEWFTRSFESSSHKTALPDAILKEILKGECK